MIYLFVTYDQKDIAKSLGAKWDPEKKMWYAPDSSFKELLETFRPLEPKKKEPAKVKITKQNHYIKLIGENVSYRNSLLEVDLLPKNTNFSLYGQLSKDDYFHLKDTLFKRCAYECEYCKEKCGYLCERFSYSEDLIQKLEYIQAVCSTCFQTIRLRDKTVAIEQLKKINQWSDETAVKHIKKSYDLWSQRSTKTWNLDISLLTNSGILLKPDAGILLKPDLGMSTKQEDIVQDVKKITVAKSTAYKDPEFSTRSSRTNPANHSKNVFIQKQNEECLL